MKVKKRVWISSVAVVFVLSLILAMSLGGAAVSAGTGHDLELAVPASDQPDFQEMPLPLEVTSVADPDWEVLFQQEWLKMGLTSAPAIIPAPGGTNRPFPYSLITPAASARLDAECLVLVLFGDGFTSSAAEQAKWRYYCQYFARNFLTQKPFDEFKDAIKIYRIDAISNASGVTRSDSPDGRNMPGDPKDTYFGGTLWNSGMARLGGASRGSMATTMAGAYFPTASTNRTILFNTSIYGGSGGALSYAGLSWAFIDVTTHEIGHATGSLPDEYLYSGMGQLTGPRGSYTNQYNVVHRNWIDNPAWQDWNPWYRLLGKNGTTFDPWLEGLTTDADFANLFRPIPNCKMRFVGSNDMLDITGKEEFGFCELCQEKWRDRMARLSNTPVLHFQPYNDQFYDNVPVLLNNRHFMLRVPEDAGNSLVYKVYGEQINPTTAVRNILGEFKMTILKDGAPIPEYTNVPADTPMTLAAGTYQVEATFTGAYRSNPYTLTLSSSSANNQFVVNPQTIITKVGKYAEPWNSTDKTDTLGREWRRYTPVELPELSIDPARVGGTAVSEFDITYTWHVRNFDGTRGTQIGSLGVYPDTPVDGPSAVGQYMLAVHSKANATAAAAIAGYSVTNEYPFNITTPFYPSNHYTVAGGTYSHELVSNDFRGITIVGEGFTEYEQDKFEAAAQDFITKFLDTDPVKRVSERFCFFIVNGMSTDSGITKEGVVKKDTYYGFQLNADGTLGTYRTDLPMDLVIFQDVWRRDTNTKTWAQWGTTVVLINEEDVQANYHWRHPEANRAAHLATISDKGYKRLIESVVTQFAHVRSNRDMDLLDTYRWMEGPEQNKTFQETMERLIESCYSHEMYGSGNLNLPRPVIVSDAATKKYISDGEKVLNWDLPATFKAYSFGHQLRTNAVTADTFTIRYYTDNGHRVGTLLSAAPVKPGFYWAEADLPNGAKQYLYTETDRYGFTYNAGQSLQGVNGNGTASSARVRGFVRFEIAQPPTIEIANVAVAPGGSVGVTYSIKNNGLGFTTLDLEFPYDSSLYKPVTVTPSAKLNDPTGGNYFVFNPSFNGGDLLKVAFASSSQIAGDELLFTVTYEVKNDILALDIPLTGTVILSKRVIEDEAEDIYLQIEPGLLIIGLLGDINGDGLITPEDAMILLQMYVGLIDWTPRALLLGDVNKDGAIDTTDAALILRMVVGG
ncbi:MAG: M64 family metallo-endopeptidase [Clostridiales bacterium]|nr:M64 family metallo-endopeptidase [Clostridiales bacterium]